MIFTFSVLLVVSNTLWLASAEVQSRLTPLMIDKIACRPEYLEVRVAFDHLTQTCTICIIEAKQFFLQNQDRYVCNSKGDVSCNHGWKESEIADPVHPCRVPICNPECQNGKCKAPNLCACEIGW